MFFASLDLVSAVTAQGLDLAAHILNRRIILCREHLCLRLPCLTLSALLSHLQLFPQALVVPQRVMIVFSERNVLLTIRHVFLYGI